MAQTVSTQGFRQAWTGAALVAVAAAAWAGVVAGSRSMEHEPAAAAFVGAWVVMMAAMMLPSAAPFVLLYSAGSRNALATSTLVAGYLAVWAAFGVLVYGGQRLTMAVGLGEASPYAVAGVLAGAGLYQLSPLKAVCLRHCRSPADFLLTHWRGGAGGAVRIGVDHGLYCLGCCWALMVVLVAAGAMGLVWVVAIALAVAAEKLLPGGPLLGRLGGVALFAAGVTVAAIG